MGNTGKASGAPDSDSSEPPARSALGGLRRRTGARAELAARQALDTLYHAHYSALVRLAALLTGDDLMAEEVAADALIALITRLPGTRSPEHVLLQLHRQVVVRSRRAERSHRGQHERGQHERGAAAGSRPASDWRSTPVVRALAALTVSQREAVVLRHYLGLSERETAAIMGASTQAVRRCLASAKLALQAVMPDSPEGCTS